ncbi:alpha/beta fold hydrolase [Polyangium aurulentum]|nr:alpha/beta fold hydrolase [Polyangium aurulentum]
MRRYRRMIEIVGVVLAGYVALCVLVFAAQRSLVFPAPKIGRMPRAPLDVVWVSPETPMIFRPARAGAPVVVHFHGNGEQIADATWLADLVEAPGAGFAAIEYPGYGLAAASGEPSEEALLDAAERGLSHLVDELGVARERLVLSGHSLGTGIAVEMARRGWGARVLLLSPYTSLPDVGARVFPFLPVRLLMRDRFDSAARAPEVRAPVLIVHGAHDELIPASLGRALSTRFPQARFVEIAEAHHNDLPSFVEVRDEVRRFLAEDGAARSTPPARP